MQTLTIDGKLVECIIIASEHFNDEFSIHKVLLPTGEVRHCPEFKNKSKPKKALVASEVKL